MNQQQRTGDLAFSEENVQLVLGRTAVRPIKGKGYGIVAAERIAAGEVIEENLCLPFDKTDTARISKTRLRHYVYFWAEEKGIEYTALAVGNLSFCNHSARPNAQIELDWERGTVALHATRPIEEGTEITINYEYELEFSVED
jgi:SET domain-containing protein